MRKIFPKAALMSGLLLTAGLVQAENSELIFDLTAENTADLIWMSTQETVPPRWADEPPLPPSIEAGTKKSAFMTGKHGGTLFEFTTIYNLIEQGQQDKVTALSIFMNNIGCRVNGVDADSPTLPLSFEGEEAIYKVNLTKAINGAYVTCHLKITAAVDTGEPCSQNPDQPSCRKECEDNGGAGSWCSRYCPNPNYSWCTPVSQATVTINNQR